MYRQKNGRKTFLIVLSGGKKTMDKADITIIGAGVIGLAVAAELARPDVHLFILEKNTHFGQGISSRNSEVIHAGIYYPAESLKARLCVAGNRMLYEMCGRSGIPHQKIGKLIVAADPTDTAELERLYAQGRQNGVAGLELMGKRQINRMEPHVKAAAALYSPSTGIIGSHDLMKYFLLRAQRNKAHLVCRTHVVDMAPDGKSWRIGTRNDRGESFALLTDVVVNCAGLSSDAVAAMMGGNYRLHYCKGDYCGISGVEPGPVNRLIYPLPPKNGAGLGVHLTMDLAGRLKLGPDATYIDRTEDYRVAPDKAALFYEQARKILPFLRPENVYPDMAGIRPKLQGPQDPFADFVIRQDAPGFFNLVGIESPGLTASPAIARYVKEMIRK